MFDCINIGTITGDSIAHLALGVVKNRFETAIKTILNIINGRPLKSKYSIKLADHAVIIVPIFVFLKIAINCETTNIKIIMFPILEKYFCKIITLA